MALLGAIGGDLRQPRYIVVRAFGCSVLFVCLYFVYTNLLAVGASHCQYRNNNAHGSGMGNGARRYTPQRST